MNTIRLLHAQPAGNKDPRECGKGRHLGFIVHGLQPQAESGRGPERGGLPRSVGHDLARACSGLSAAEYFGAMRKACDAVKISEDLKEPGREVKLRPAEVEAKFAAANPRFPKDTFRATCYQDGELQDVRICFSKDLSPRACGSSAGSCRVGTVTMLPVR